SSSRSSSSRSQFPLILITLQNFLVLILLTLIVPPVAIAQPSVDGLFGTDEDFTLSYDLLEADVSTEGGGRSLVVLGNVVFKGRGFALRADAIGIFIDGVDAKSGPIHPRILAIGEVLLSRGDQSFRASTIFLDVDEQQMVLSDARLRISQDLLEKLRTVPTDDPLRSRLVAESWVAGVSDVSEGVPSRSHLGIEAKLLRVSDFSEIEGQGITVTTDEFFDPEWALVARVARARSRKEVDQRADEDLPGGYLIDVEDARLEVAGIPVIPFSSTSWDTRWGGRSFPLRDLRISDSSRFGNRIDTAWNGDFLIPERFEDEIDLTPRIDDLSDRGTGLGLDFELGRDPLRWAADPDGRLELFGYGSFWGIQDDGLTDSDGSPVPLRDRSRARAFLHARFGPQTLIDGELATSSDAGFVEEYFRAESRTLKKPENYLSLRQIFGESYAATALAQTRVSDHLSVLEKDPEFSFHTLDASLAGLLRWDSDLTLSSLRWLPEEGSVDPVLNSKRTDLRTELSLPLGLSRWTRWVPSAGVRYTSWDSIDYEAKHRTLFHAGLEGATRLSRVFDVQNPSWGIDGLRHVIDLTAGYSSYFDSSIATTEVPVQIDEVDALTDFDQVHLSVVQRLQTRDFRSDRERIHQLGTRTMAEARVDAFLYPDPDRDNDGERWGHLFSELVLHGTAGWSLFGESVQDVGVGESIERNAGLRWLNPQMGLFELAWRERPNTHRTLLIGGRTAASDRWDIGLFVEYDALDEQTIGQWWEVGRNFRTFRMLFSLDLERGDVDETTFRVDIGLREMMGAMRGSRIGSPGSGRMR
ncbi:MAG: hypothetical protein OSB09_02980, partial [Planctomycetota bacterium]|nr:hypothetical protein [Planctomycetota bacterium]